KWGHGRSGARGEWQAPGAPKRCGGRPLRASTVPALREVASNGMSRHVKGLEANKGKRMTAGDRVHTQGTVSEWRRTSHEPVHDLSPRDISAERSQHIGPRSHSYDMTSSLLCN